MKIQILGGGCAKCQKLAENALAAITETGLDAEIDDSSGEIRVTVGRCGRGSTANLLFLEAAWG